MKSIKSRPGLLLMVSLALGAPNFGAGIIYVDARATGTNDGTSWVNAYTRLQSGLTTATPGTEIWVANGTYRPANAGGDRNATFSLKAGVGVYGGFAGADSAVYPSGESQREQRDCVANPTILSGDLNGNDGPDFANNTENSFHVVTAQDTDGSTVLDGFTIQGGNADGIYVSLEAQYGGGVFTTFTGLKGFTIDHCTITGNCAKIDGGGIFSEQTQLPRKILNCTIRGNRAGKGGGGICARSLYTGGMVIAGCTIQDNSTTLVNSYGGGIYCLSTMLNSAPPQCFIITNCLMTGNRAVKYGGGVVCLDANNVAVSNCTFANNYAPEGRTLACTEYYPGIHNPSQVHIANSIIWDNPPNLLWTTDGSTITVSYCTSRNLIAGIGNVVWDPGFISVETGNFRLSPCSPCIDAGDNAAFPADLTPEDRDGNSRFADDAGVPDIGHGAAPVIDMGAFEFQGTTTPPVPAGPAVAASDGTDGGFIRLTWEPSPTATSYQIWRSSTNDPMTATQIGTTGQTGYDDTTAARAITYWYWVSAGREGCTGRLEPGDAGHRLYIPGDADVDCDVDQEDFGRLQLCLTDPGVPFVEPNCAEVDWNCNGSVDQQDVSVLLPCFTGPGIIGIEGCAPACSR